MGDAVHADPEAALLTSLQHDVREASDRLAESEREVLTLRELEQLSYDEIAETMGVGGDSVAALVLRARIRLRDELRGSALAGTITASPDCERAQPLIAARHDGQLPFDSPDRDWLAAHMADCEVCRLARDAMLEAALSYRAQTAVVVPILEAPIGGERLRRGGRRLAAGGLVALLFLLGFGAAAVIGGGGATKPHVTKPASAPPVAAAIPAPSRPVAAPAHKRHRQPQPLPGSVVVNAKVVTDTPATTPPAPVGHTPTGESTQPVRSPSTGNSIRGGSEQGGSPAPTSRAPTSLTPAG